MYRSGAVMAWNVFKFCTALRGLGSIMILLVLGVVGVSYYAVVITNYGPGLAAGGLDSLIAFFVLALFHSLFYTFLETSVVTLSLLTHFIQFFSDGEIPGTPGTLATTFLAFVLNLAFALSVMGFLILHISLVCANTTTIEAYEKKSSPKWHYDLGRKRNFEQVFGMDRKFWFIPGYSEEDLRRMPALHGLEYPSKPDLDAQEL
ncbi:hypothetical protein SASPL_109097 [Salvia splendens]|uniref:Palmitoyltransferase n=1 Tax=Salvia splendens TaxID=180675 RepID=A0A8X9A6S8_SALSN|nr:hypothetical protein SASPL_109097 [Salvia splendens]